MAVAIDRHQNLQGYVMATDRSLPSIPTRTMRYTDYKAYTLLKSGEEAPEEHAMGIC